MVCAGLKATSFSRGSPLCELVLVTYIGIMVPKEVKRMAVILVLVSEENKGKVVAASGNI